MSDERAPVAPKRPGKTANMGNAPGDLRFDRERATAELKRFADLVVRETGLAIEYDIVPMSADGAPDGEGGPAAQRPTQAFGAADVKRRSLEADEIGFRLSAAPGSPGFRSPPDRPSRRSRR